MNNKVIENLSNKYNNIKVIKMPTSMDFSQVAEEAAREILYEHIDKRNDRFNWRFYVSIEELPSAIHCFPRELYELGVDRLLEESEWYFLTIVFEEPVRYICIYSEGA
jgi:hypothetical protein